MHRNPLIFRGGGHLLQPSIISGIALVLACSMLGAGASQSPRAPLIPTPKSISWLERDFVLDADARIVIPRGASREVRWAADALQRALGETANARIPVTFGDTAKAPKGSLVLCPGVRGAILGDEGYTLRVEQANPILNSSGRWI